MYESSQVPGNQAKYLGNTVTADAFKPDPEIIKAIINMPELQSKLNKIYNS